MGYVQYTAKRALVSGVNDGDTVAFALDFRRDDRSQQPVVRRSIAEDGTAESTISRIDFFRQVEINYVLPSQLPELRQFLASVAGGEIFTFDPDGTAENGFVVPVAAVQVEMPPQTIAERRLGAAVATSPIRVGFRLREV